MSEWNRELPKVEGGGEKQGAKRNKNAKITRCRDGMVKLMNSALNAENYNVHEVFLPHV